MFKLGPLFVIVLSAVIAVECDQYEEFDWAEQVAHENGSAKETGTWAQGPYSSNYDSMILPDVEFYLYTKDSLYNPIRARVGDEVLFEGRFDKSKSLKILTHGYYSGRHKFFAKTIREAYLAQGDYNIINVDWSKEAHTMYPTARKDVAAVGRTLALFIEKLANQTGYYPGQMHLIGHSLGAHVSGVAGLTLKQNFMGVQRITGLDPAGPDFSYSDKDRLMPEAAETVDVIHTCGHGLGFYQPLGHADFYPNHGTPNQPGCGISFGKCSHKRAIQFFAESISNPNGFVARKCDHWKDFTEGKCDQNPIAFMGEVSWGAKGRYWLKTNKSSPFALEHDGSLGKSVNLRSSTVPLTPSYHSLLHPVISGFKHIFNGFLYYVS